MKTQYQKSLSIKSSKLMNSLFAGNFKAAFSGKGIEFQDFREYSYGDDARYIDWSVSSREQSTIMRRYREEKQGNILCILDVRDSLSYGNKEKVRVYINTLELLYHASKLSGESFGGYILDAGGNNFIPATKTPLGYHRLEKLSHKYKKNTEKLSLDFLMKNNIKRSVIFVISDNLNIDEKSFKLANIRHDIVFVHVSSHFENTLEGSGISRLKGFIVGRSINLDDKNKREEYTLKRKQKLSNFSKKLKKYSIDSVFLDEKSSIFAEFLILMKRRKKS